MSVDTERPMSACQAMPPYEIDRPGKPWYKVTVTTVVLIPPSANTAGDPLLGANRFSMAFAPSIP
jgi:hypothetical protein